MRRLEKTNITWTVDVIDKLGWEAQRPLDTCWIQEMLKHVVGCPCYTTKPRPWTWWARDCQPLDEQLSPDSSSFAVHVGYDRWRRRGESTKAEDDVETSARTNQSRGRRMRRGVRGLTCSGAGWAGGAVAAGQCVGVEGWPGQRHRL